MWPTEIERGRERGRREREGAGKVGGQDRKVAHLAPLEDEQQQQHRQQRQQQQPVATNQPKTTASNNNNKEGWPWPAAAVATGEWQ